MDTSIKIYGQGSILVTGGAGFIGYHLCRKLLGEGYEVVIIDNLNDYYEVELKMSRLKILEEYYNCHFYKADLADKKEMERIFGKYRPQIVVNLAAQAGVRYSIDNPDVYMQSNVIGFFNILECCRYYPVKHLLFASSSSVYGANRKIPYSTSDKTDTPVSLYAATKKTNEILAYSYSKLYQIPTTGLRFFTVYGPFGRPDMAYFSFTRKILADESIKLFNYGDMYRDFTYIDDIVRAIELIMISLPPTDKNETQFKIYNIGNSKPEKLTTFVNILEACLDKKARIEFLPMQAGDVYETFADIKDLEVGFNFKPYTSLNQGLDIFIKWYLSYYN